MKKSKRSTGPATDHLANERTFLAWIRTGVAIIGLGFVIVKSSSFFNHVQRLPRPEKVPDSEEYTYITGMLLVLFGGVAILMSMVSYHKTEILLQKGLYNHSAYPIKIMAILLIMCAVSLFGYLAR